MQKIVIHVFDNFKKRKFYEYNELLSTIPG